MALEIINEVKAAEQQALETRRVAAVAAKDAVKLAAEENQQIMEKELSLIRQKAAAKIEAAEKEEKARLDALAKERAKDCDELKRKAGINLSRAADACLERILK